MRYLYVSYIRGFTLIEMMVAVTIFSMVMLVSVGTILTIVDANRKAQSIKAIVNNINFTVENISRNIRTGTNYRCMTINGTSAVPNAGIESPQDCPTSGAGGNVLALESQFGRVGVPGDQLIYRYVSTTPIDGHIVRSTTGPGPYNQSVRLTSPEVVIENLRFYVDGAVVGDGVQPRVSMVIKGYAIVGGLQSDFNIQTTAVQRALDI